MAEYYPLLAKAVANLKEPTVEARRAIYERARKALIGQLRNADPPVPDADIAREEGSLNAAIIRLEAESRMSSSFSGVAAPAAAPPAQPGAPKAPQPPARASMPPPARPPMPTPKPPAPPVSKPANNPPPEAPAIAGPAPGEPEALAVGKPKIHDRFRSFGQSRADGEAENGSAGATDEALPSGEAELRPSAIRPAAPTPKSPGMGGRIGLIAAILAGLVAIVAIAAYVLRDKPEDFTPAKPVPSAASNDAGKISGRAGGAPAAPTPPASPAGSPQTGGASPSLAPPQNAVPVTQRAAMLVQDKDEPQGIKTFVGSVAWTLLTPDGGSPVLRAQVTLPEANYAMTVDFAKNTDSQISASHIIDIRLIPNANSALGDVGVVSVPEMRGDGQPQGTALAGISARKANNDYIIGLTSGDTTVQRNLDLLREQAWVDVPFQFASGKLAKITFEKGVPGDQLMRQALTVWGP